MKEVTGDCPLGSKCEDVREVNGEQVLVRCPWHMKVRGTNASTKEEHDEWRCSIAWMPVLLVNSANESRKTAQAVEQFRNRMVEGISQIVHVPPVQPEEKLINGRETN
jgi:hypothetical protein